MSKVIILKVIDESMINANLNIFPIDPKYNKSIMVINFIKYIKSSHYDLSLYYTTPYLN